MATKLYKPVSRVVEFSDGKQFIVTLQPATPESRFDALVFRPRGCRKGGPNEYQVPLESARNIAAERTRLARIRERKATRKAARAGGL